MEQWIESIINEAKSAAGEWEITQRVYKCAICGAIVLWPPNRINDKGFNQQWNGLSFFFCEEHNKRFFIEGFIKSIKANKCVPERGGNFYKEVSFY
jgi:hypothetical protein